ncbi:hypothetical protein [Thermophilibacter sp.]
MARRSMRGACGGGREPPSEDRRSRDGAPLPRARLRGGDEPRGTVMPAVGHAGRRALSVAAP